MKIDGRKLSTEEQAFIRRMAVQRVLDGENPAHVIRSYGLSDRAIYPWLRKAKQEGLESLNPLPRLGRDKSLSEAEEQEMARWVMTGDPRQYGFDFGLWTRQIVADLIDHRLGVRLSLSSVGRLLHRQGMRHLKSRYAGPMNGMRRRYKPG